MSAICIPKSCGHPVLVQQMWVLLLLNFDFNNPQLFEDPKTNVLKRSCFAPPLPLCFSSHVQGGRRYFNFYFCRISFGFLKNNWVIEVYQKPTSFAYPQMSLIFSYFCDALATSQSSLPAVTICSYKYHYLDHRRSFHACRLVELPADIIATDRCGLPLERPLSGPPLVRHYLQNPLLCVILWHLTCLFLRIST